MVSLYYLRSDVPNFNKRATKISEKDFEAKFGNLKRVLKNTTKGKTYGINTISNKKKISIAIRRKPFKFKLLSSVRSKDGSLTRNIDIIDLN